MEAPISWKGNLLPQGWPSGAEGTKALTRASQAGWDGPRLGQSPCPRLGAWPGAGRLLARLPAFLEGWAGVWL